MRVISRPGFRPRYWVNLLSNKPGSARITALRRFDLTLRRQFRLTDRFSLQARGDIFNIFNRPNLGNPTNYLYSSPSVKNPQFGQSTTAFDDPTAWQQHEASFCHGVLDHFEPQAMLFGGFGSGGAGVTLRRLAPS